MLSLDDIIYMIVTDRFAAGDGSALHADEPMTRHGGTLAGVMARIPYLKDLGVTLIWLTPVYPNPAESYHGYHPLDFESVDPRLSAGMPGSSVSVGREAMREFVRHAHHHGLKVMLDLIVSHTGPDHPWMQSRRDWIDWDGRGVEKEWFKNLPNLNHDNIDVNAYFVLNVLDWVAETGADAIRIDAARHVESVFWQYLKVYANGLLPENTIVGEFWDGDPHCLAPFQNLHGFDGMFDFPLYHAIRDVFADNHGFARIARKGLWNGEPPGILDLDPIYRNAYNLVTFVGNHDTPRFFEAAGGAAWPDAALAQLKMAMAFVLTSRGIPQIYYGDELAMPGGADPDNRQNMPWAWINADASGDAPRRARDMLQYTKRLIALRQDSPALRWGLRATLYVTDSVFIYLRVTLDDAVLVALNNGDNASDVCVPLHANPHVPMLMKEKLLDGLSLTECSADAPAICIEAGQVSLNIPARSVRIYRTRLAAEHGAARRAIDARVQGKRRTG